MKVISQIVSYIFHPLFIPLYTFILLFSTDYYFSYIIPVKGKLYLLAILGIYTIILPGLTIYLLKKTKVIESYKMNSKKERTWPLINIIMVYTINYYFFNKLNLPNIYSIFLLSIVILSITGLLLTLKWKISLHTLAAGGISGYFFALSYLYCININIILFALLLISGTIASARLYLNEHNSLQVYSGYIIGLFSMFIMFLQLIKL
ncbi:MAG: hypothetical protein KA792_01955 [Bacteroidales bacterium]|nr:hypothetical protein [Bacteroidales bacterium]